MFDQGNFGGAGTSVIDGAVSDARDALTHMHELGLSGLDPAELEAFAVAALELSERATALTAKVAAHADRTQVARRRSGRAIGIGTHLAALTGCPTVDVNGPKNLGRWLDDFPTLADAWSHGRITEAHLRELRKAHNGRIHLDMFRAQDLFIEHANTLDFTGFLSALAYWLLHVDPDGDPPSERNRSYGVKFSKLPNGDVKLAGVFDPIVGEALQTAVEHELKKVIDRDKQENDGDIEKLRSFCQNTLVALTNLVTRGFRRESGEFPIPLVNIVMSETVAEDLLNRGFDGDHDPFTLPLDAEDVDGRCETIRGTPIHPRHALAPLLIGRLRRQIFKPKDQTFSKDTRLFNWDMRNALLVLSRGRCTSFGCDTPFMWLVADHVHPSSLGGLTELDNGEIRCGIENSGKGNTPGL